MYDPVRSSLAGETEEDSPALPRWVDVINKLSPVGTAGFSAGEPQIPRRPEGLLGMTKTRESPGGTAKAVPRYKTIYELAFATLAISLVLADINRRL
jgi:hypothetical protein